MREPFQASEPEFSAFCERLSVFRISGSVQKMQRAGSESDRRDNLGGPSYFLGQRRRRQQRRRGPAGANGKRDTDFYRVTRSQSRLY
ncbi:uncharacterized protein LOC143793817 isoform X2 [Ranitomeya variabilis]|uniref:uncharacterized protein LOC143793817 isoform X2 n=1 Tax=Ranitomeya variabilis TaxID=490064 RepID=UPI0040562422